MITTSPLLGLRLDVEQCAYIVYVNGGIVTANLEGTVVHEDQPINHWLRSGTNDIEVHMYREQNEVDTCEMTIGFMVKDVSDESGPGTRAFLLAHSAKAGAGGDAQAGSSPAGTFDSHRNYRTSDHGDLKVGPVTVSKIDAGSNNVIEVVSRTFDLHLPFPEWAFFHGDKVRRAWEFKTKDERMVVYDEIMGAYHKLWDLLAKKDVNGFLDACEERSHEIDLAFFKKPGETRSQLRKQLESAMSDATLELRKVETGPGKYWKYSVGSKGNLLALTAGTRLSPILRFEMKDETPFSLIFPVVFRKEGNRYIVTR